MSQLEADGERIAENAGFVFALEGGGFGDHLEPGGGSVDGLKGSEEFLAQGLGDVAVAVGGHAGELGEGKRSAVEFVQTELEEETNPWFGGIRWQNIVQAAVEGDPRAEATEGPRPGTTGRASFKKAGADLFTEPGFFRRGQMFE